MSFSKGGAGIGSCQRTLRVPILLGNASDCAWKTKLNSGHGDFLASAKKKPTGRLAFSKLNRPFVTTQLEALSFFELVPLLTVESVPDFESSFFELVSLLTVESVPGFESSFFELVSLLTVESVSDFDSSFLALLDLPA
jgi:hypothetical protein